MAAEDKSSTNDDTDVSQRGGLPDRYVYRQLLGTGSAKEVYLCFDTLLQRLVAVSRVSCADGIAHRRVLEEARTWAMLSDHPHVVNVHDIIDVTGGILVVQQYLQGGDLCARLDAQPERRMGEDDAISVALTLSRALEVAHRHGVVHCDLKPANVLFSQQGVPHLADFGTADTVDWLRLDQGSDHFGTPAYMAPEQIRSNRVDPKVDIYALGCLMYELVCGRPAYSGSTRQVIEAKIKESPPATEELPPFVSEKYLALTHDMLEADPAGRPESMEEVARQLLAMHSSANQVSTIVKDLRPLTETIGYREPQRLLEQAMSFEDLRAKLVIVEADAGMGKTRLINRVGVGTATREALFLHTQAGTEVDRPFGLFANALERLRRHVTDEGLQALIDDVLFPLTAKAEIDASGDVVNRLVDLIIGASELTPVVLVLDDLHWADASSLTLFEHLTRKVMLNQTHPLCLICSFRPREVNPRVLEVLASYRNKERCQTITLNGLSLAETKEWLTTQTRAEPARQLVIALKSASGGNPLFLKELFEHLRRAHALGFSEGRLVSNMNTSSLELPANLDGVIAQRLARLSGDGQRLMTFASLMGAVVNEGLLRSVVPVEDQQWAAIIDECLTLDVLEPSGESYRFSHPLVQHSFTDRLSEHRQERVHHEIAERLIAIYQTDAERHCLQIAHHLVRGGYWPARELVVRFATLAGNTAFSLYAFDLSGSYFAAACRAGVDILERGQIAELHYRTACAYGRGADVGPSLEHIKESVRLYEIVGDVTGLATALELKLRNDFSYGQLPEGELADVAPLSRLAPLLKDSELQVKVYDTLASAYYNGGDRQQALALGSKAMDIARATGSPALRCIPATVLALCELDRFELRRATEIWQAGLLDSEVSGDDIYTGYHLQRLPLSLFHMGEIQQARVFSERAHQHNFRINNIGELTINLAIDVMSANLRGDLEAALEAGLRGIEIVRTTRYPWAAAMLIPALAQTQALLGEHKDALATLENLTIDGRVFDDAGPYRSLGRRCGWLVQALCFGAESVGEMVAQEPPVQWSSAKLKPSNLGSIAVRVELAALLGKPSLAGTACDALQLAQDKEVRLTSGWTCSVQRLLALANALRGDLIVAREMFDNALRYCQRTGMTLEAARVLVDRGQMEARHPLGDPDRAVELTRAGSEQLRLLGVKIR